MAKDADEIRSDIEYTRSRLGDTVEALGYKADIPSRAKDAVGDTVAAVKSAVAGGVDAVRSAVWSGVETAKATVSDGLDTAKVAVADTAARITDSAPTADDLRAGADRASTMIRDNPVSVAVGSVAVGFLMGLLLPRTSIEEDRVRDVKRMAKDVGAQVVEAGKQMVRDTMTSTFSAARRPDDAGGL